MQKLLWLPAAEGSVVPINPRDWLSDGLTPYYELIVRTTLNSRLAYYIVHPRNISTVLVLYFSRSCFYCRSIMTMECRPWRFLLLYKQSALKRLTQLACTDKRINIPLFDPLDIAFFPKTRHTFRLFMLKCKIFVYSNHKWNSFNVWQIRGDIFRSVVCFLLGNSPASELYMPTFRNTLSVPS